MPRETIGAPTPADKFNVVVDWSAAGGAQVGLKASTDKFLIDNQPFESVWADIDRQGCNDLIRIVRRARDAAFGRDE